MTAVPPPATHQDRFGDAEAAHNVPESFDREFWSHYLRDLCGFDPNVLDDHDDAWIWARAREVTE